MMYQMPEEDFATSGKYFILWGEKIQTPRKEKMNELMEWNVFNAIHQYGQDTNTLHSIHTKLPCYLSAQFEVVVIPNVDQHQMFFMSKKKLWH